MEECDTEEDLDIIMSLLPTSLSELYDCMLSKITSKSVIKNLKILLCWLLYSERPLTLNELRDMTGIDWRVEPYFDI